MAIPIQLKNKTFLIPQQNDPCELWRTYFTQLKKAVGKENAKMIWLVTWSKNGNSSCTTASGFNRFLKQNQIDVSSAATRAVADVANMGSNVLGLGKTLTKMLSVGIPVALAAILIVILVVLFKTAKKAEISDIANLTPIGKAAGIKSVVSSR